MIRNVRMLLLAIARCRPLTERRMWNIEYRQVNVDGKLRMLKNAVCVRLVLLPMLGPCRVHSLLLKNHSGN